MRKHEFQLVPGREDDRKERKRSRYREPYDIEGEFPPNMMFVHPTFPGSAVSETPAKFVYLEAMQTLQRDRLQSTWGRVQQKEEMDYEPIIELETVMRRLRSRPTTVGGKVLEEFEGAVDKFEGNVAHITLKTQSGETFYGEYPASELKEQGIRENRRFKCWTVEEGTCVKFVVEPILDRKLTEERERQIDEWLLNSLGDDHAPQNDY